MIPTRDEKYIHPDRLEAVNRSEEVTFVERPFASVLIQSPTAI